VNYTKRFIKDIFCKVKILHRLTWEPLVSGLHIRPNLGPWQYVFCMIGHNVSLDRLGTNYMKHCL